MVLKNILQKYISFIKEKPEYIPYSYYRFYSYMKMLLSIVFLVHFLWIFLFFFLNLFELVYYNIFSCILLYLIIILHIRGKLLVAIFLLIIEFSAHAVLSIILLGWNSGFSYHIILLAQVVNFYPWKNIISGMILSIIILTGLLCLYLFTSNSTLNYLGDTIRNVIYLHNLFLLFTGAVLSSLFYYSIATDIENRVIEEKVTIEKKNIEINELNNKLRVSSQKEIESRETLNDMIQVIINSKSIDDIFYKIYNLFTLKYNLNTYLVYTLDEEELLLKIYKIFGKDNLYNHISELLYKNSISILDKSSIHRSCIELNKSILLKKIKIPHKCKSEEEIILKGEINSIYIIPLVSDNKPFGTITFSENKFENSGIKDLSKNDKEEIEKFIKLISPSIFQSLQKQNLEKAHKELQATQAQLVEAEKSAALGQLISGVAHEINNPLAAIRSSAEILELDQSKILKDIPKFFQSASSTTLTLFLELQSISTENKKYLSSKEERLRKKKIRTEFETIPFESTGIKEETVDLLCDLFLEDFYPKLKENFSESESLSILQMLSLFSTQKNALKNIRLSTEKSARVIFSLRKYLGTDIKGTPRETRISELIETSLRVYDNYIQGVVHIYKDYSDDRTILCVVDEIQQVFKNLIFNAIQSMYSTGSKRLKLVVQNSDKSLYKSKIIIEDSGEGVGEEVFQKLFTPFFTTKSRGEGIGLGLYVSKLIVEEHGGKLEYEALNEGSRFVVWI